MLCFKNTFSECLILLLPEVSLLDIDKMFKKTLYKVIDLWCFKLFAVYVEMNIIKLSI